MPFLHLYFHYYYLLKEEHFSQEDIAKDFFEALIHTYILQGRGPQTGVQASNFGGIHECVLFS